MPEYFDVIDENGNLTGEVVERSVAHTEGIRHRASHLWLVRNKNGKLQLLLQKRAHDKDSFPDCYDISSAGHISAGENFENTAIRELSEELGIHADKADLIFCGDRNVVMDGEFHGKPFHDRELARVFMMWLDKEESLIPVDHVEVDSVHWMDLDECFKGVETDSFKHCIVMEELEILSKALNENITV